MLTGLNQICMLTYRFLYQLQEVVSKKEEYMNDTASDVKVTELPLVSHDFEIPLKIDDWNPTGWKHYTPMETQKAIVRLRMTVTKFESKTVPQHNGLWVRFFDADTLGQTIVNSGQPVTDGDELRGWYLDHVELYLTMNDPQRVPFQGSRPQSKNQTGTITSTAGFNVSGGLAGSGPSMSIGYTKSQSTTEQLQGVTFSNKSTTDLLHYYTLSAFVGGHAAPASKGIVYGGDTPHLRRPPAQCFGDDLPIISQAYWTIPLGTAWNHNPFEIQARMTIRTYWIMALTWTDNFLYAESIVQPLNALCEVDFMIDYANANISAVKPNQIVYPIS